MALKQAFYYLPLALCCSVRRQCRSLFSAYKSINFLILGLEKLLSGDYGRFARVHVEAVGAAVTNACDKGTHGTSARGKSRCKMHPDQDNRRPGIEILVQRSETAAPGPQISASTPGNGHETRTRCPRAPPPHGVLISAVNAADSMWAMLAAPLIAGNDLSNMDAATKTIFSTKKSSPWIRTARDSGTSCRANWQCRRLGKTTDRRRARGRPAQPRYGATPITVTWQQLSIDRSLWPPSSRSARSPTALRAASPDRPSDAS
jgi:hypothetical protein